MKIFSFIFIGVFSLTIHAETQSSWYGKLKNHLIESWQKSDQLDLYLPLVTYHNRSMYSKEKIDSFNERPWGLGLGYWQI